MSVETYSSHMQWCKKRALAYIDAGDYQQAFASFASDVRENPLTDTHAVNLMIQVQFNDLMVGKATLDSTRKWIEGFAS